MRAFIPVLLSVLIALGGSYFLYDWIQKQRSTEKVVTVKETRAVSVVVAKVDLPWGSRINPETLTTTPYFEESVPNGHFSNPADIADRIVVSPVAAGEPVLESRLAPTTLQQGGISAVLKPGTRAVSVQGNKVLGVAGFINPGNRVDVLLTVKHPETEEEITKTVLENMLVLASGTQLVENKEGKTSPVDVFTLEVTPDQGERLTLAANEGRLQFALRGATDDAVVLTKGVTLPEVLASLSLVEPQPAKEPPVTAAPAPKQEIKTVIKYIRPEKTKKAVVETIKGLTLTRKEVPL